MEGREGRAVDRERRKRWTHHSFHFVEWLSSHFLSFSPFRQKRPRQQTDSNVLLVRVPVSIQCVILSGRTTQKKSDAGCGNTREYIDRPTLCSPPLFPFRLFFIILTISWLMELFFDFLLFPPFCLIPSSVLTSHTHAVEMVWGQRTLTDTCTEKVGKRLCFFSGWLSLCSLCSDTWSPEDTQGI